MVPVGSTVHLLGYCGSVSFTTVAATVLPSTYILLKSVVEEATES